MSEPIWSTISIEKVPQSDPRFSDGEWESRYVRLYEILDDVLINGHTVEDDHINFGGEQVPAVTWNGEGNYGAHGELSLGHGYDIADRWFGDSTFEQECMDLGVAFRVADDPKCEYEGQITAWRPGWPTSVERTVTEAGSIVIHPRDLLWWIERAESLEQLREQVDDYANLRHPIQGIDLPEQATSDA